MATKMAQTKRQRNQRHRGVSVRRRKVRPSRVKRYRKLAELVEFASGRSDELPDVSLAITQNTERREKLRRDTATILRDILRGLAATAGAPATSPPPWHLVPLPTPPAPRLLVYDGGRLDFQPAHNLFYDVMWPALWAALQAPGLHRLRCCPECDELFIAFDARARTCSPTCSNHFRQRKFYAEHRQEILDLRKQYYQNRKHNRMSRERRHALRATVAAAPRGQD